MGRHGGIGCFHGLKSKTRSEHRGRLSSGKENMLNEKSKWEGSPGSLGKNPRKEGMVDDVKL